MRRAGNFIQQALSKPEVFRAAKAYRILREWEAIVGPEMALRSTPDRFEKGTVYVAVSGASWAQEMRMNHLLILDRLKALSDDPSLFQQVRFGVRKSNIILEPLPEPDSKYEAYRKSIEGLSLDEVIAMRKKKRGEQ